jgi:hypothetical protein
MEHWLQIRLTVLGMTHEQFVKRLAEHKIKRSRVTITNWVNGTPISLFTSPDDTKRLANALEWSVDEMLLEAGYEIGSKTLTVPMELIPHIRFYKRLKPTQQSQYLESIDFVASMIRRVRDDKKDGKENREER